MNLVALRKALILGLLLLGLSLVWQGSYIKLKASLAEWLISATWEGREAGLVPAKPWPWADTRVVARLSVPGRGIRRFVMQDASGESLAFGPGSMIRNRVPGEQAYTLIAGHRDTHFRFLSELEPGDVLEIDNYLGQHAQFRVSGARVINTEQGQLGIDPETPGLTLVTCWPFDALVPGG
ncbi:MAG: class GN sortase, partial [Proteobacteria bacterium]|nr:class GN sortase [Pseudomonadota bacterium]